VAFLIHALWTLIIEQAFDFGKLSLMIADHDRFFGMEYWVSALKFSASQNKASARQALEPKSNLSH
jgi:hypothetical protein